MSYGFTNCGDNLIAGICVFYFVDKVGMLVHAVYDKSFEKPGVGKRCFLHVCNKILTNGLLIVDLGNHEF
jgi:hypothetical protein